MLYRSVVDLPLHSGECPRWLFDKMVRLSRAILLVIYREFGRRELILRLSDPFWFQALGCLVGFDWHSSGLTTTLGAAVKKALEPYFRDLGIFICGGKGKSALNTPKEIEFWVEKAGLENEISQFIILSRLIAKIDNHALQDGFHLYFHLFIFSKDKDWAIIQQGMDENNHYARRYHWNDEVSKDLFSDPHKGILSTIKKEEVLNLVSSESKSVRDAIIKMVKEDLTKILKEIQIAEKLFFKRDHSLNYRDIPSSLLPKIWEKTYENPPQEFKDLLLKPGFGAKALRALTLTAELIYNVKACRIDPVHYSFAHGGKDGYPYKIDPHIYEHTIAQLEELLRIAPVEFSEKKKIFKGLLNFDKIRREKI